MNMQMQCRMRIEGRSERKRDRRETELLGWDGGSRRLLGRVRACSPTGEHASATLRVDASERAQDESKEKRQGKLARGKGGPVHGNKEKGQEQGRERVQSIARLASARLTLLGLLPVVWANRQ
jgi:hypothetical protein